MSVFATSRRAMGSTLLLLALAACSQSSTVVPVRSFEQSGRQALVCLSITDTVTPGRPLDTCAAYSWWMNQPVIDRHMYTFVTQIARGELAVIDLTAGAVVDMDPSMPGFNFVPVGGLPRDVVATPGGTAVFSSAAEPSKYGIYAVPTSLIVKGEPRLTEFPACAMPSAPGRMLVLVQPLAAGATATDCLNRPYGSSHPLGDLIHESEPQGPRKLLVTLPDTGDIAIVDAQELLDRPSGSFDACPIEYLYHLSADLPSTYPQQRTPVGGWPRGTAANGGTCDLTAPQPISTPSTAQCHPVSAAYDPDAQIAYVADDMAPVVHALDTSNVCAPKEISPLIPMSYSEPTRTVVTKDVAVSPLTSLGQKFLYASDYFDGSLMAFDVSSSSTDRTPMLRQYPARDPFERPDRVSFTAPVQAIAFGLRDAPIIDPTTGVTKSGIICDPSSESTGLGVYYRTSADYTTGAGPSTLRGIYAFVVLTNGELVNIDVDDFDAPCRRSKITGSCPNETYANYLGADGEIPCATIEPHQARSTYFLTTGDLTTTARLPDLLAYPILTLNNSVLLTDQSQAALPNPKLLAPNTPNGVMQIGGLPVTPIETDPSVSVHNMVMLDYREPRTGLEQDWTTTFEGGLPGFSGHLGRLAQGPTTGDPAAFYDAGAFFCDNGIHDMSTNVVIANQLGIPGSLADSSSAAYQWAVSHADVVQISQDFLDPNDPYWPSVVSQCSWYSCQNWFGTIDVPNATRDLAIQTAYQGQLLVQGAISAITCCFPTVFSYNVRARQQWVSTGTSSGFLHHVVADPTTGQCRDTCDPNLSLRNGRALEWTSKSIPNFDDPAVFKNPVFQFVVWPGTSPSTRDMVFSYHVGNGFVPRYVNLAASTSYVQPQSMQYIPQLGQLLVVDGSVQGLMVVDPTTMSLIHSYY